MCKRDSEHITIKISDNGKGLPENFDFEKTKSVGMSIVRSVIKEQGAEIWFAADKGTSVTIKIPLKSFDLMKSIKSL